MRSEDAGEKPADSSKLFARMLLSEGVRDSSFQFGVGLRSISYHKFKTWSTVHAITWRTCLCHLFEMNIVHSFSRRFLAVAAMGVGCSRYSVPSCCNLSLSFLWFQFLFWLLMAWVYETHVVRLDNKFICKMIWKYVLLLIAHMHPIWVGLGCNTGDRIVCVPG